MFALSKNMVAELLHVLYTATHLATSLFGLSAHGGEKTQAQQGLDFGD